MAYKRTSPQLLGLQRQPVAIRASSLGPPVLSYDPIKQLWRLEQDYAYVHAGTTITVPAGFEFDLASVPKPLWWLISPFDLSIVAPLIHDFLYRYEGNPLAGSIAPPRTYTRKEADRLFRYIMKQEGVWWWRRAAAYRAVRTFGRSWWGKGP